VTAEEFPVIDFIQEELDARGWDMWELARRMGGEPSRNKLALEFLEADPTVMLGDDGAEGVARAFGTSKEIWLNLEKSYRVHNGLSDIRCSCPRCSVN
jgi:plasmid maintenance system antidote protein VapI